MPNPERRPEKGNPAIERILQFADKMGMKKSSAEMRLAKKLAIRSLGMHSYSEQPDKPMSLKTLRAEWARQLPEVSLSRLISSDKELGY